MQRLSSLRDTAMPADPSAACPPPGSYAYGLNMVLPTPAGTIQINSKRMERDFRLTSVASAFQISTTGYSLILGTENVDWFADFVRVETIMGDGTWPHFLPEDGVVIEKGDSINVQARFDSGSTEKRIALIFQGIHL